jgi:hypothetical protein
MKKRYYAWERDILRYFLNSHQSCFDKRKDILTHFFLQYIHKGSIVIFYFIFFFFICFSLMCMYCVTKIVSKYHFSFDNEFTQILICVNYSLRSFFFVVWEKKKVKLRKSILAPFFFFFESTNFFINKIGQY